MLLKLAPNRNLVQVWQYFFQYKLLNMKNYNNSNNPEFFNNYIMHLKLVESLSERTIQEYFFDTRLFLRYIHQKNIDIEKNIEDVDISSMQEQELKNISISDIYDFFYYSSDERKNNELARYRKVSSLHSFFKYLTKVTHILNTDPTKDLDISVPKKNKLPKYLSLNESVRLLNNCESNDTKRDYCILTLFLNCGLRLSELVGMNITDIDFYENQIRVIGKGSKERKVYLNDACINALNEYLVIRKENPKAKNEPALFISNQNKRISKRRVQQIVENSLQKAGLNGKGITTHKLRHTAATLMYQYGEADALILKELLGHESVATTEIYTHLDNENVRNAVENNPLAKINKIDKKEE